MSLQSLPGVWEPGVWAPTAWGEGVWYEDDAPPPVVEEETGTGARATDDFSLSYINARKRREAEEQEAMAAFAAFMMAVD